MEPAEAQHLAETLLTEHGLKDWSFRFDHSRQRLGCCHYQTHEITLSKHLVRMNHAAEVRQTLLHEIAHALVGPGHGHDGIWQTQAMQLGIDPTTTNSSAKMPPPPWALRCRACQQTVALRHRRSLDLERVRCRVCGVDKGRLQWVRAAPQL